MSEWRLTFERAVDPAAKTPLRCSGAGRRIDGEVAGSARDGRAHEEKSNIAIAARSRQCDVVMNVRKADIRGGIDVREVGREAHTLHNGVRAIAADDRRTLAGGDGLVFVYPIAGDERERSGTALS